MDTPAQALPTVRDLVLSRADDDSLAMLFENEQHTYRDYTAGCVARAHLLLDRRGEGPFHVGALLDNGPEYSMLLGGAAVAGAAVVGINPTRQGAELARDITHADCGMIISEAKKAVIPLRALRISRLPGWSHPGRPATPSVPAVIPTR